MESMTEPLIHGVEQSKVASGKFRLNARFFDENKLQTNMHRLSLVEQISRPTIARYLRERDVDIFSGDVIYAILVTGFGLSPEEIRDMKVGDLFEIVNGEAGK